MLLLCERLPFISSTPSKWLQATVFSRVYPYLIGCRKTLKSYDLFGDQKRSAYTDSEEPVRSLTTYLCDVCTSTGTGSLSGVDELFSEFVEVSWSLMLTITCYIAKVKIPDPFLSHLRNYTWPIEHTSQFKVKTTNYTPKTNKK